MPGDAPMTAERRFYAGTRAIGRLGMRIFEPAPMAAPHWHGHVEMNLVTGGGMAYRVEDDLVEVPEGRLVAFWAGLPHQLVRLSPRDEGPLCLANLYLPLDSFLFMPHVAALQVALLSGGMALLPAALVGPADLDRWHRDYRSGNPARRDILVQELNATLRRALLDPLTFLRPPLADTEGARRTPAPQMAHVVAMIRHVMDNLASPMTNADVARVTGLNPTYAMGLFTAVMRVPLRRFVIRMRLMRARALLLESDAPAAAVGAQAGFPSVSQFYAHFRAAYGTTPQALRKGR